MNKRPVIIDCDPGIDDAQALMLLNACDEINIVGITTTFGNVPLEMTSSNALGLCDLLNIDTIVARGAEKALLKNNPSAEHINGKNGMGEYEFFETKRRFYPRLAWELIYETALQYDGELEIVAMGPLTNIAIAVLKYPNLAKHIKKLVVMGGAAHAGNVTPYAEFNVWQDPEAMAIVLEAGFKNLIMVDLDACKTAYLTDAETAEIANSTTKVGKFVSFLQEFRNFGGINDKPFSPFAKTRKEKTVICDAVAAAVLIDDTTSKIESHYIICECQGSQTVGQTIVDWENRFDRLPNVFLVRNVDRKAFVRLFFKSLNFYAGQRSDVF